MMRTLVHMNMRDRMLAGELYLADDPDLARDARRAMSLTHRLNMADPTDGALLRQLLTELLGAFGEGSEIRPPFRCDYGYQTFVGARTFANYGLISLDVASVTIGDDVQIGPNVQLLTALHPVEPGPRRAKWEAARPIRIGHNVWLGGGAIILPGVTIGDDSVVGAGAVVTRDLPPAVVAAGNPARVIRSVDGRAEAGRADAEAEASRATGTVRP
jgi:maltose O-acetyltransferase